MVGPSKILTVSYGTFSCTLEGFDEPFSTMKSIAEYFRDLAADDRYFGAEPPTPDAEMLHRIAEQEVQRRVEARVQDDGIVLRQLDDQADAPASAGAPATTSKADTDHAPAFVAPAPMAAPVEAAPLDAAPVDDGSIAAKLSRIRAVVARSRTAEDAEDDFDVPVALADAYSGSIESAFDDVDADDETAPIADIDAAPTAGDDDAEVTLQDASEEVAEEETAPEGLAAFEDAAPEPDVADVDDIKTRIIQLKRSDAAPAEPVVPVAGMAEADASAPAFEAEDMESFAPAEPDEIEEAEAPETEAEAFEFNDLALNDGEYAEDLEDLQALDGAQDADVAEADVEPFGEPEIAADPQPAAEADAAEDVDVPEDQPAAQEDEGNEDQDMLAAVAAACIPEDEGTDLAGQADAELASDIAENVDDADDADETDDAEPEPSGEAAFDRILEETNSKLDEDESSRRRSAIAHLKAAVAATKADRSLSGVTAKEEEAAEEQSRYRADLAKVVRPRRPEESKASHERPSPMKESPSPLMLVSAQRVDAGGDGSQRRSILPRRVNTAIIEQQEDPMTEGASSFADFAKQVGATELPDLLEAAAAYSAFVEGRREFSRPQLMRRVASYEQETFTREAGLRSFGQLLRQGKIQKLKRGQFTITDDTRFNPEARIAGE